MPEQDHVETRETLVESDDGTEIMAVKRAVRRTDPETGEEYTAFSLNYAIEIHRPDGQTTVIPEDQEMKSNPTTWRIRLIEQMASRVEYFEVPKSRKAVPVNIINQGKPAITSYLYAVHGWTIPELHELLDLTGGTIDQYIKKVANDKR